MAKDNLNSLYFQGLEQKAINLFKIKCNMLFGFIFKCVNEKVLVVFLLTLLALTSDIILILY
ncbi:hypothetical protein P20480_2786 [Pseudoalteromonas sp. BSi20480]|nr:hypothetical protein P20480_2786 [Pseudoalteromonas sp. BSi20480]